MIRIHGILNIKKNSRWGNVVSGSLSGSDGIRRCSILSTFLFDVCVDSLNENLANSKLKRFKYPFTTFYCYLAPIENFLE